MLLDTRKTKVIEIEVTQEDIAVALALKALKGSFLSQRCAMTVALNRQLGGRWAVDHESASRLSDADHSFLRDCPHDGRDIVSAFDAGFPTTGRVRIEVR